MGCLCHKLLLLSLSPSLASVLLAPLALLGLLLAAALENCGFPASSALFVVGSPGLALLGSAPWEAGPLQAVLDIPSLVGDILWACVWFT